MNASLAIPFPAVNPLDISADIAVSLDDDGQILSAFALSRHGRRFLQTHASPVGRNYRTPGTRAFFRGLTVEVDNI